MKKSFKKFGVIVLALAMVFALTATAWAAESDNVYTGSKPATGTYAGSDNVSGNTITMYKTIVVFNTKDNTTVREPNITFNYSIAKVNAAAEGVRLDSTVVPTDGVTITDANNKSVTVYNGVISAIGTHTPVSVPSSVSFGSGSVAATTKGVEVEKPSTITVDAEGFPHAGVFRYVITETADPADVTLRGLEERDTSDTDSDGKVYSSVRYLDIYVRNTVTGLEVYGAVLFKTNVNTSGSEGTDDITTTTEKTTGFEPGTDGTPGTTDYTDDDTVDRYFTYNLEVTKAITGNLADKTHDFPFEITLTGNKAATIVADYVADGASYDGGAPTTVNISTTPVTLKPKMSDGDKVTITGIPVGTKVTVKEMNDTVDVYKLTTATAGSTGVTELNAATIATAAPGTGLENVLINSGDASKTVATANTAITFTNNLEEISITGITLRVAPFAAMAGAGVLFLAISKKSKKEEEEE